MKRNRLEELLQRCVRRGRVLTSPAQLAGYDADGLGYKTFAPDAVVIPADAEELAEVLKQARQLAVPVCMRGAGTSLSGGPVAAQGGVIVHASALRSVRTIRAEGFWCEVECGVTLNQLDERLKPHGLFYPPDPSSGPVCTLGGNVAMNAGGAHCFRYGVTSNYVLGVEVVLLDGSVHRFGGPAGGRGPWREDWKRLMVGSEGTLGAFTRFWLRLLPRPDKAWTFRATYPDLLAAERAIHALVTHASFPVAIELMDPRCVAMVENSPMAVGLPTNSFMLLTEIDGPTELVDARVDAVTEILRAAGSPDVHCSDDASQRERLWKARKAAGGLMGQLSPDVVVQDAVIPKRALAEMLQLTYVEADAAGIPVVNVFHAGDGNLHPTFLFDSRTPGELEKVEEINKRFMRRVVEIGGTLSGEHGIGNDKSAYMPLVFDAETIRLQLAVSEMFNPQHQLNPLKVFADRRFAGSVPVDGKPPATATRTAAAAGAPAGRDARTPATPATSARCFTPFFDAIDGLLCVSADATVADVRQQAEPHRLRFPLILDPQATLREQVDSTEFAPTSSRFGPYCDNITGMNWRLPSGRVVRLGERVVKTTTGYDLMRFLLSSAERWGEPVDYVLRLRIDCGETSICEMSGEFHALSQAVNALLKTCWTHWFDSVDLLMDDGPCRLRIVVNCPPAEWPIVEEYCQSFASAHGLTPSVQRNSVPPADGCPDFVLKTAPDQILDLTRQVAAGGVHCVALCTSGVLHGYIPHFLENDERRERVRRVVEPVATTLFAIGGDWHSRHVPPDMHCPAEADWLSVLEREVNAA